MMEVTGQKTSSNAVNAKYHTPNVYAHWLIQSIVQYNTFSLDSGMEEHILS